jgi:hypothetical protein
LLLRFYFTDASLKAESVTPKKLCIPIFVGYHDTNGQYGDAGSAVKILSE